MRLVARTVSGMGAIAAGLARIDAGVSWTRLQPAPDDRPGWVRCADLLADPTQLVRWQGEVADVFGGGDDDGRLTGQGLVLDWYLAAVLLPAVGLFHLGRRVPDLAPERVLLLRGPAGSPPAAAALEPGGGFCCLTGDPTRHERGAEVVGELDALATVLRAGVIDHAARLLTAYAATTRIGRHGLWGAVTDAVDVAFMTGGWVSGDMAGAAADARLVLRAGAAPLVGGSTLHEIADARGRPHWTRRRYSCCFVYRVPGEGECVTCPRVGDDARAAQAGCWD